MKRLALALTVTLGLAAPAAAQQEWSDYDFQTARESGYALLLYNEATGEYQRITLETLLAGLVEFPDGLRRYVALKESAQPTFTGAELAAGTTVESQLTGLAFPTVTGMPTALWVGIGVEQPGTLASGVWYGSQPNQAFNNAEAFTAQATTVTIAGDTYNVFVSRAGLTPLLFGAGQHIYFSRNAVNP